MDERPVPDGESIDLPTDIRRVGALLDAVLTVGSELDLGAVLRKLLEVSVRLVDAEYGALGVVGEDKTLAQFLTVGIDEEGTARIGHLPRGRGILGLLVEVPEVLRLDDLTQHPSAYGFPPNHPPMRSFLGVPVRVRDEVFGIVYHTQKRGGGPFTADDEAVAVAAASAAGVAIENARLYDEARHRERWIGASTDVTTAVLSGEDAGDVLALVAERASVLLDADLAFVSLPDDTGSLVVEVVGRERSHPLRGTRLPSTDSLAGEVFGSGTTMNVVDLAAHPGAQPFWDPAEPPGPALLVPLVSGESVRGVLTVARPAGAQPFDPSAVLMLRGFADQAALALELAERRREAEQMSVLRDRDRIARDLHDLVIQRLFATGMKLESALPQLDRPDAVAALIHGSVDELDITIGDIRTTIFALQDSARRPVSLRSRVLDVVLEVQSVLPRPPSVRIDGLLDTRVPGAVGDHLVAVLSESLSNVVRHAEATTVEVVISVEPTELILTVSDDGVGVPDDPARGEGLSNLEQRAETLGGTCTVGRRPRDGTEVLWRVPLEG